MQILNKYRIMDSDKSGRSKTMKGVPVLDEEICVVRFLDPYIHLKDPSQLHITHCKLCRPVLLTVLLSAL